MGTANVGVSLRAVTAATVDIRRAGAGDVRLLGRVLADAFTTDPVWRWLIPEGASRRAQRLETFFTAMSASYVRRGKHAYLAAGDGAVALWSAPGTGWALPPVEIARQTPAALRSFGPRTLRALRSQLQVEAKHPREPEHWYLGYLGARGARQGRGLGSQLLDEVLDVADARHQPGYLESSNERNLPLYERKGFRVVEQIRLLGTGPPVWRMWREAR